MPRRTCDVYVNGERQRFQVEGIVDMRGDMQGGYITVNRVRYAVCRFTPGGKWHYIPGTVPMPLDRIEPVE